MDIWHSCLAPFISYAEWMGKNPEWAGQHYEFDPGQAGTEMVSFIT